MTLTKNTKIQLCSIDLLNRTYRNEEGMDTNYNLIKMSPMHICFVFDSFCWFRINSIETIPTYFMTGSPPTIVGLF